MPLKAGSRFAVMRSAHSCIVCRFLSVRRNAGRWCAAGFVLRVSTAVHTALAYAVPCLKTIAVPLCNPALAAFAVPATCNTIQERGRSLCVESYARPFSPS